MIDKCLIFSAEFIINHNTKIRKLNEKKKLIDPIKTLDTLVKEKRLTADKVNFFSFI